MTARARQGPLSGLSFWGPFSGLGLAIAAATLVLDQASKLWLLQVYELPAKGRVEVAPFLDLVFVRNTGISYSMFDQSSTAWQLILAGFAVLVSLALWVWLSRDSTGKLLATGLALIIGGAVGNAIDRLYLGGVADFVSLHAWGFYWYVFNVADVAIVAGVAALLYESFFTGRNDAAKQS